MDFKCPKCKGPTKLVHQSKDGKVKFYECKRGHQRHGIHRHPVFMVEEEDSKNA